MSTPLNTTEEEQCPVVTTATSAPVGTDPTSLKIMKLQVMMEKMLEMMQIRMTQNAHPNPNLFTTPKTTPVSNPVVIPTTPSASATSSSNLSFAFDTPEVDHYREQAAHQHSEVTNPMSGNAHSLGFGVSGTQASHLSPSNPVSLTLPIPDATHHYTTSPLSCSSSHTPCIHQINAYWDGRAFGKVEEN